MGVNSKMVKTPTRRRYCVLMRSTVMTMLAIAVDSRLLPDTELAEHNIQNIVDGDFAGDFSDEVGG